MDNQEALGRKLEKLMTELASGVLPVRQRKLELNIANIKRQLSIKRRPDTTWGSRERSRLNAEELAAELAKQEAKVAAEEAAKAAVREQKAYNNEMNRIRKIDNAISHQKNRNMNRRSQGKSVSSNANIERSAQESANLLYRGVKPSRVPDDKVIMEGDVEKLSPSAFSRFQKRYLTLYPTKLKYKEKETSSDIKGEILVSEIDRANLLDPVKASWFSNNKKGHFNIVCEGRTYEFLVETENEARSWVTSINAQVDAYKLSNQEKDQQFINGLGAVNIYAKGGRRKTRRTHRQRKTRRNQKHRQ